ncbi:MAG: ChaN family lipoprotein [Candidatus Hydrogenedentes bacterium]|nr:ChaN family lipoprotein [Candidatus Hydrogenedentota bacterium]
MHYPYAIPTLLCVLLAALASSCATTSESRAPRDTPPPDARAMPAFDARSGEPISWPDLLARAAAADIVILGEQHGNPAAHAFEAALAAALLESGPRAICLEMLERDEQPLLDAYLTDAISKETFVDITDSRDWAGKDSWDACYQPLLDTARKHAAPVIAANAPRRLVRLARLEGFPALQALQDAYPAQAVLPAEIEETSYQKRFRETMQHHAAPGADPEAAETRLDALFRAQQVWDATMAHSTLQAAGNHGHALLVVGQFHTDFDGGLLLRMKAAEPDRRYLTISLQPAEASALRPEDEQRADIVVYAAPAAKA